MADDREQITARNYHSFAGSPEHTEARCKSIPMGHDRARQCCRVSREDDRARSSMLTRFAIRWPAANQALAERENAAEMHSVLHRRLAVTVIDVLATLKRDIVGCPGPLMRSGAHAAT